METWRGPKTFSWFLVNELCIPLVMSSLRVGVIGATGMTGSHAAVELLNRGHKVVGISRSPSRLGKHERYKPKSIELGNSDVMEIAKQLHGLDVVVNAYGPHSQLGSAFAYSE